MEKHQIQPQNFEENIYELPGIWDKTWVRPYESIWSILNTYKKVNVIPNNTTLMKALGIRTNAPISCDKFLSYGIFCNVSNGVNNFDKIISALVPGWYKSQIEDITLKPYISHFFTEKISYCPECMKEGYHSIFHQLKGIQKCPFHPKTLMISYLKERYILGKQSPYKGNSENLKRYSVFVSTTMYVKPIIDFEDNSQLPLPLDRTEMPEIYNFITSNRFRNDFDYISVIGADINDENIIPEIGQFLFDVNLKPEMTIEDSKELNIKIINILNTRISKSGLNCSRIHNEPSPLSFKYIYLKIFINEKLNSYTYDEIDYKCYQIERGRFISFDDELGMILLYLLYLTGDERIEESLSIIRDELNTDDKTISNYRYYQSEICIHDLDISDFSIAVQYYILEDYMNTNFEEFIEYAKGFNGMEKPLRRKDLILFPKHIICTKQENIVKIYKY